jgi:hypothetical protein
LEASRAEMQRLLAAEFERRGWVYDLATAPTLLNAIEQQGELDAASLARAAPSSFLQDNDTSRDELAEAIQAAIGNLSLAPNQPSRRVEININDNRHSVNLAEGARIESSNVNTGAQIAINSESPKEEVLDAVATLVTAGLGGEWNTEAVEDLAQLASTRPDISLNDIQARTVSAAQEVQPTGGQVRALVNQIAAESSAGVLVTGVTLGLGALGLH